MAHSLVAAAPIVDRMRAIGALTEALRTREFFIGHPYNRLANALGQDQVLSVCLDALNEAAASMGDELVESFDDYLSSNNTSDANTTWIVLKACQILATPEFPPTVHV